MTRSEFLNRLKHDLGNDLNSSQVQEQVNYYDSYIREEMDKGRSESEVVDELGDPWAIAKNIVCALNLSGKTQNGSGKKNTGNTQNPDRGSSGGHSFSLDTRWKRILVVAAVVVVLLIVLSLFHVVFRVLSPILIVGMVVLLITQFFSQRRGGSGG